MTITIQKLTPDLWSAHAALFDTTGPAGRCWCMYWRIGSRYRQRPLDANKKAFHELVENGPPPGLLAFEGEKAVGWCQVTPRNRLPWLDKNWRLKTVDTLPVWSISCFYIHKAYRRQGISQALIRGALQMAEDAGAPALEAYPLDAAQSTSSTFTGYLSTFQELGFEVVARHVPQRPIVRFHFSQNEPIT